MERKCRGGYEPFYNIKYVESNDGINWEMHDTRKCIEYKSDVEAIARPWVVKENNKWKMWYSYRKGYNYRSSIDEAYKIGYAESSNGRVWERKDEDVAIDLSDSGWDAQMMCYNSVFEERKQKYMLYNGNAFGKAGFGIAIWKDE